MLHHVDQVAVEGSPFRQLRMERGGYDVALLHKRRLPREFRQNFNARPRPLDNGAANENHFQWVVF